MYKVLGADQKEYGPVSADQIRQWIAERRLSGVTMIQAEGTLEWKPLAQFQEFASALASGPYLAAAQPQAQPLYAAGPRTNSMAIAGLICGILSLPGAFCCCGQPFSILGVIFSLVGLSQINQKQGLEQGRGIAIAGLVLSLVAIALSILGFFFGFLMNFDEIRREIKL